MKSTGKLIIGIIFFLTIIDCRNHENHYQYQEQQRQKECLPENQKLWGEAPIRNNINAARNTALIHACKKIILKCIINDYWRTSDSEFHITLTKMSRYLSPNFCSKYKVVKEDSYNLDTIKMLQLQVQFHIPKKKYDELHRFVKRIVRRIYTRPRIKPAFIQLTLKNVSKAELKQYIQKIPAVGKPNPIKKIPGGFTTNVTFLHNADTLAWMLTASGYARLGKSCRNIRLETLRQNQVVLRFTDKSEQCPGSKMRTKRLPEDTGLKAVMLKVKYRYKLKHLKDHDNRRNLRQSNGIRWTSWIAQDFF